MISTIYVPQDVQYYFPVSYTAFDVNAAIKNETGHCLGRPNEYVCNSSLWEESWNPLVLDGVVLLGSDML